jgi:hypothetical protein
MPLIIQKHQNLKEVVEQAKREGRSEFAKKLRQDRVNEFVERTWPKHGRPRLPRFLLDTGIVEFMEQLDPEKVSSGSFELNQLDWFIGFMDRLPDTDDVDEVARKAQNLHFKEMKAGRAISFTQAVASLTGCQTKYN